MSGQSGRSGGKRLGAGRKPKYVTNEYQRSKLLKKAKKWAKELGRDEDDVLLAVIHGQQDKGWELNYRDRIAAYEIFKKYTQEPEASEQNINISRGPAIGLPPLRQDPALEVVKGGRKEKEG